MIWIMLPELTKKIFDDSKKTDLFFLILTVISGIIILFTHVDFIGLLSQGDHGRDFYAFYETSKGAKPYRDYYWLYGPLMPYYYAPFYKLLGANMQSILLAELLLKWFSGIFIYLTLRFLVPPIWAFLTSFHFFVTYPFFFYTFNHTGGIFFISISVYLLLRYIFQNDIRDLYLCLASTFLLCFVKINFGVCTLFLTILTFVASVGLKQLRVKKNITFLLTSIIAVPFVILLIHYYFVYDLSWAVFRQSFPYLNNDLQYSSTLSVTIKDYFILLFGKIKASFSSMLFWIVNAICIISLLIKRKPLNKTILFAIGLFVMFYIIFMHEFLRSGVPYRLVWVQFFGIMLMYVYMALGSSNFKKSFQLLTVLVLFFLTCYHMISYDTWKKSYKTPQSFIQHPRGKIFVQNSSDWINTFNATVDFLEKNLDEDDKFLALPYTPIYYFMTDKKSPTRQLAFFEYIQLTEEQEQSYIEVLKDTKYVVMSNRTQTPEPGLKYFGKTHCVKLNKYIEENYEVIKTFGDWNAPGGWAWNHAIRILKQKS